MGTTNRLEQALEKLYAAFNNNTLNPGCCKQCAVGTILDGTDSWKHLSDDHGSLELNYIGQVNDSFGKRFNGYRPSELLLIEHVFLNGCGFQTPLHHQNTKPTNYLDKDNLFTGLCLVVACLCELDKVPNVLAIEKLTTYYRPKKKPFPVENTEPALVPPQS